MIGLVIGLVNFFVIINYVCKCFIDVLEFYVIVLAGFWDIFWLEGDILGLIIDCVGGCLVVVREEGEFYLDCYVDECNVFYGVVSVDLMGFMWLNLGYSINEDSIDGISFGVLLLFYSNG